MSNKKIILLLVFSIFLVIAATIGVTYAYLSVSAVQSSPNTISTSCFDMTFTDSNVINVTGYPMSNTAGLKTTPYTFSLKNKCNTETNYQVVLNIQNTTSAEILPYINYSLDGQSANVLSNATKIELPSGVSSNNTSASYILDTGSIIGNTNSVDYNLRIWISEDGGNDLMTKTFVAEVMIYSYIGNENIQIKKGTIKNLIVDGSFENNPSSWSGLVQDSSEKLYGNYSSKLEVGSTSLRMNNIAMLRPILNHKYYGRHSIKTDGNVAGADCRFEWFAGDGAGLNFVFGHNTGNHPDWYTESAIIDVDAVNGTDYIIRNFIVYPQATLWSDGLMIIDLTETFGAGNEPSKEWCDANIPFFTGTKVINYRSTT